MFTMMTAVYVIFLFALVLTTNAQCVSDADLAHIAAAGKRALEANERYTAATQSELGGLPFDFRFAPANYSGSGVNPSSRYVVPRIGPWLEGDLGGDSFLNWGVGEVSPLTSREALVVLMCTPPPLRLWTLEMAILYRMNKTNPLAFQSPGASISNTVNSATLGPAAKTNEPLLVIVTADSNTEADVKKAFKNITNVATIVINGTADLLHFGTHPLKEGCDIFQLCMRVHASPAQAKASAFAAYLGRRFPLLLVKPSFAAADAPLYPIADRAMRVGPTTEVGLTARRAVLRDAVVKRMQSAQLELRTTVAFSPVELDKRRCLLDPEYRPYGTGNCFGTSSDGRYTLSHPYTLPAGNLSSLVLVVIGANHAATGNAADNQLLHDTKVSVNPEGMEGSAQFYLGPAATPADAGLFAFAFTESCADQTLLGRFCAVVDQPKGGAAGALLRLEAYLDNESGTRPSLGLVHPLALVFTASA